MLSGRETTVELRAATSRVHRVLHGVGGPRRAAELPGRRVRTRPHAGRGAVQGLMRDGTSPGGRPRQAPPYRPRHMNATVVALFGYLVLQFGIGAYVSRRLRSEDDYLVAGRSLGWGLGTFTIFATWFGAETVIGSAGTVYSEGVGATSAEPFGYALALILMGVIFAVPLWRRGLTTLADLFDAALLARRGEVGRRGAHPRVAALGRRAGARLRSGVGQHLRLDRHLGRRRRRRRARDRLHHARRHARRCDHRPHPGRGAHRVPHRALFRGGL